MAAVVWFHMIEDREKERRGSRSSQIVKHVCRQREKEHEQNITEEQDRTGRSTDPGTHTLATRCIVRQ